MGRGRDNRQLMERLINGPRANVSKHDQIVEDGWKKKTDVIT